MSQTSSRTSFKIAVLALLIPLGGLAGCASNCAGDPNSVSRMCAASYKVGMNSSMDEHLAQRQAEADALRIEAAQAREELTSSQRRLDAMDDRLAAQRSASAAATERAKKLRREIDLKRRDLESLNHELADLQQRVKTLEQDKSGNQATVARLDTAKTELREAKHRARTLQDYLNDDLLIRAENALKYD